MRGKGGGEGSVVVGASRNSDDGDEDEVRIRLVMRMMMMILDDVDVFGCVLSKAIVLIISVVLAWRSPPCFITNVIITTVFSRRMFFFPASCRSFALAF